MSEQVSKRQKKIAEAKSRNMTKGQLWRAREKQGRSINGLKGKKGILVISNRGREHKGTDEAITLLELQEDDDSDEDGDGADNGGGVVDLQAAVEQELAAARTTSTARYHVGMPCLTIVRTTSDPVSLLSRLFNSVIAEGKARSTHIEKLIPFQAICHPSLDTILKCTEELIKDVLSSEAAPKTFAIYPKVRGGENAVDRAALIKAIADQIDQKRHPVNLTEPDIVILVEIVRSVAGVSIIPGTEYRKFKKYHLRAVTGGEVTGED